MKIGRDTGSVINSLMSMTYAEDPVPEVGMAATILYWSDRDAATVVRVSKSKKTVWVTKDTAQYFKPFSEEIGSWNIWDTFGPYTYTSNPDGPQKRFRRTKTYGWRGPHGNLCLGRRESYFDPSF